MNKVPVYWRRLIVRAIEDAIVVLVICIGIWLVGAGTTYVFDQLHVLF